MIFIYVTRIRVIYMTLSDGDKYGII